jgi:Carboxypeptidase regulatory-like domain
MRHSVRICAVALIGLSFVSTGLAKKKRVPLANVSFVVIRDENSKPVRNAAVVMHPVDDEGKQQRNGLELKTDTEGKASFDGVPYGKLRIQVLAQGFQTYGEDYDVDKPIVDVTVKMKRPARQYSIYEEHGEQQKPDEKKPQQ